MSVPLGQAMVPASGIDCDAREIRRVTKRLEYAAPLAAGEIDIPNRSVREGQAQPVRTDDIDRADVNELLPDGKC